MDFPQLLREFGVPTAFLGAVLFVGWHSLRWLGENAVRPAVQAHVRFVTTATQQLNQIAEHQRRMTVAISEIAAATVNLHERLDAQGLVARTVKAEATRPETD